MSRSPPPTSTPAPPRRAGLWDARLEALVVDSILTGEADEELPSRIAALGWHGHGEVAVLVGTTPRSSTSTSFAAPPASSASTSSSACRARGSCSCSAAPSSAGTARDDVPARPPVPRDREAARAGLRPRASSCSDPRSPPSSTRARAPAPRSAGFAVARAWRNAPRPVEADDLLPERALAGDPLAKQTLVERIYRPLQAHSADLVTTLWSYLDNGRSLEATARELFVHPNTVRYRLKRVSEVIGWDATGPREALILQTALILGSIGTDADPPAAAGDAATAARDLYGSHKASRDSCDAIARSRRPILGRMDE